MEKASSSTASGSCDSPLNGLKFGEKIYFEDIGGSGSSKTMAAPMVPAEAPPEMKGKGVAQQKLPRCQVEGCNLDLTGAKAYYCRHKVCGMHSKSPKVFVAGLEQRFCQQCSRFHLLTEFDQGKRSCRRRLAGHNERRRKTLLGPLISRYGRLASFHEDKSRSHRGFLMDFTYQMPQIVARDVWPTMRSSEWEANNQWQVSFNARPGFVPGNPYPTLFSPPELEPGDCLVGVSNTSCALSLLSTPSWDAAAAAAAPPRNHGASAKTECDGSQPNMTCSYMNSPCAFEDLHASGSSSFEMGPRHMQDTSDAHFSNELGLALQARNRKWPDELSHHEVYHDHDHHQFMHWSLYE